MNAAMAQAPGSRHSAQAGFSYAEVLMSVLVLAILLVPALQALSAGIAGSGSTIANRQLLLRGKMEEVLRYYVAGATKEEAGEVGDAKNVIAVLPDNVKDSADKSGAVALPEGKGTLGVYVPSGSFALRLDGLAYTNEPTVDGAAPEEGKKFVVVSVTAKNITHQTLSMFDVKGGDFPHHEITDSDNEAVKPLAYRKMKRDEDPEREMKPGDEYSFRIIFVLPKDATAKKLILGAGSSRKWTFDVSTLK